MAEKIERVNKVVSEKLRGENVVLAKFKKKQEKEDKYKRWEVVDEAISAARNAYMGNYGAIEESKEQTVDFEKAISDLIEVLGKIQEGEIKSSKPSLGKSEVPSIG